MGSMSQCSPEDYLRALADRTITCLTRWEAIGLTVTVEAGLLSLLSVLFVVSVIIVANEASTKLAPLPSTDGHPYGITTIASLFVADTLQGIGSVLSLKWVIQGKSEVGSFCAAQGIIKTIGATGVALSAIAIAVYTFLGVFTMRNINSMKFTLGVVVTLWCFIGALVGGTFGGNLRKDSDFMAPASDWCWINLYDVEWEWKLVEYLLVWLALLLSILIYVPLFLWMRGNIIIDETARLNFSFRFPAEMDSATRHMHRRSIIMLLYPIVYSATVPLSIVRWITFVNYTLDSNAIRGITLAANAVSSLSGFLDVILLLNTRPSSGLFGNLMFIGPARPPSSGELEDEGEMSQLRLPISAAPIEI